MNSGTSTTVCLIEGVRLIRCPLNLVPRRSGYEISVRLMQVSLYQIFDKVELRIFFFVRESSEVPC